MKGPTHLSDSVDIWSRRNRRRVGGQVCSGVVLGKAVVENRNASPIAVVRRAAFDLKTPSISNSPKAKLCRGDREFPEDAPVLHLDRLSTIGGGNNEVVTNSYPVCIRAVISCWIEENAEKQKVRTQVLTLAIGSTTARAILFAWPFIRSSADTSGLLPGRRRCCRWSGGLAVFVHGALALAGDVENLAQLDAAPDLCPAGFPVAVDGLAVGVGRRLVVPLEEEDFGDAVVRERTVLVEVERFVELGERADRSPCCCRACPRRIEARSFTSLELVNT